MNRPRIGLSACIFHPDLDRPIFKGKSLLYAEESMMVVLSTEVVPLCCHCGRLWPSKSDEILDAVDGLLLQGGVDMSPSSYDEVPISDAWLGDKARDDYEIALVRRALEREIPVLGSLSGCSSFECRTGRKPLPGPPNAAP